MTYSKDEEELDDSSIHIDFKKLYSIGGVVSCIYHLLIEVREKDLLSVAEVIEGALMGVIKEAHGIYRCDETNVSPESKCLRISTDDDMAFIEHFCSIKNETLSLINLEIVE